MTFSSGSAPQIESDLHVTRNWIIANIAAKGRDFINFARETDIVERLFFPPEFNNPRRIKKRKIPWTRADITLRGLTDLKSFLCGATA